MGANPQQTLLAFREAEAYPGPSLILAYSHCIAHGINMQKGMQQQDLAVACGYWPLMRYNPEVRHAGENPFVLDSPRPRVPFRDYAYNELRYRMLTRTNPAEAEALMARAEAAIRQKWDLYEEMATDRRASRPAGGARPMIDLATTYMGLHAQASHRRLGLAAVAEARQHPALEDAGAAAVVMFSLFEEQIQRENAAIEQLLAAGTDSFAEALGYFPAVEDYEVGPEEYLELIRRAREATAVPIIASLNGITGQGWVDYAGKMEEAGAAASSSTSTTSPPIST